MGRKLFALCACLFFLAMSREPPWSDAHVVYATTQSLVDRGALDLTGLDQSEPWFFVYRGDKKYGPSPLGSVIAMVPSYLVYKALRRIPALPDAPLFALTSHLSSALLMALAVTIFYRLCRRRASPRTALLLSLTLGLGTICFCYARSPYSEALQTAALLLLVERTLSAGERPSGRALFGFGAVAGLLVNAKLVHALLLPLCLLYLIAAYKSNGWSARQLMRNALAALAGFLPFAGVLLVHDWVKTGSVWHSGYHLKEGLFSGDLFAALYGYVFSTGKSLFLYSPPLLLGLLGVTTAWQRQRRDTALLLSMIGTVMLASGKYYGWHGDHAWGPRYLVPLTPLILLLAVPWLPEALDRGHARLRRLGLALLLASGLGVQLAGSAFYWDHYIRVIEAVEEQTGMTSGWSLDFLPHGYYIPQFSPIEGHFWLLRHYVLGDRHLERDPPWRMLVPKRIELKDKWAALRLDWWGADWLGAGRAATGAGLGLLLLLAGGALASSFGLKRRLAAPPPGSAGEPPPAACDAVHG